MQVAGKCSPFVAALDHADSSVGSFEVECLDFVINQTKVDRFTHLPEDLGLPVVADESNCDRVTDYWETQNRLISTRARLSQVRTSASLARFTALRKSTPVYEDKPAHLRAALGLLTLVIDRTHGRFYEARSLNKTFQDCVYLGVFTLEEENLIKSECSFAAPASTAAAKQDIPVRPLFTQQKETNADVS